MIIKNKNKKNLTIDLKGMYAKEYLESRKTNIDIIKEISFKIIGTAGIVWFVIVSFVGWGIFTPETTNAYDTGENISIRDSIRLERLEVCQKAYKKTHINEQFLYDQIPAVRCATYMSLIYAFESNFWKSRKCTVQKNCHGMKGNWYDHPAGFITFDTYTEGREWFANRYFKFHYKKNIRTFVYNWSMTDREIYVGFVEKRYWKMYNELEYLYMTSGR